MKLFKLSSSQSRYGAPLCFINGGPNSALFSNPVGGAVAFNSRPLALSSKLLMVPHNKIARRTSELILLAMCNSCITRFYATRARKSVASLRSLSSLVLAAHVTPSSSDTPQRSEEWFALRKDKLTTSTFSTALGFWKGQRRLELWQEKVFESETQIIQGAQRFAMDWGVLNEEAAIERYKSITGREVGSLGFAVHAEERFDWLGASPDGLLDCFPAGGLLEVKCPYNKGKPEMGLPWSKMPFYYMPQVQGQMEIMDREWLDLYCWTPNGSTVFRVCRERSYWELIHGILREFWWENVVPAREALLLGREGEAESYKPSSTHKQTGLAIFKSAKLAGEAKLLCREIAGHVEFYGS
ncbi:Restriction endonuclease, type II-like superfamily protein [Parasponia andersonii]|uniref:Restriction endonuclease, type II-like superfamily protein n=1 Tax=Parasponia andersonii TaxID=3476 RepID=A0A2P5B3Q4_PARAD|nr:Restriction endonuclease, type II-like superfamily protein [Parasponia andersonii]